MCKGELEVHSAYRPGPPPSAGTITDGSSPVWASGRTMFSPSHWSLHDQNFSPTLFPASRHSFLVINQHYFFPSKYFFLPSTPSLGDAAQQSWCTSAVSEILRGMICPSQATLPHPTVMTLVTPHPSLQVDCHNLLVDLFSPGLKLVTCESTESGHSVCLVQDLINFA